MVSATASAKKTSAPKKPRSHPPYVEMISEAITTLKERTGSSQVAIAKFTEEKQKDLPPNFRKLLSVQLKKLVASGKLTKIKSSFKIAPVVKPPVAAPKPKKAPATKKKPTVGATAGAAKAKPVTPKKKVVAKKPAAAAAAKKVKKPAAAPAKAKKTPMKKAAVAKAKKTPTKKPKTIKTPAKKVKK